MAPSTSMSPPTRVVADLGNSRLKLATLDAEGRLGPPLPLPTDEPDALERALDGLGPPRDQTWAVGSVNPPLLERLLRALEARGVGEVRAFRSALDVPQPQRLEAPGSTGADRALAVFAARLRAPTPGPGLVVSCGTAVTVEHVDAGGVWLGGAIAPGLGPLSRAMHELTAQLPLLHLEPSSAEVEPPPPWGPATVPAMTAGLVWGLVGIVRELVARQSAEFEREPWVTWTGGDADWLARLAGPPGSRPVPDLVLRGLAAVAFGVVEP